MKRFFCLLLVLLLFPFCSLAEPGILFSNKLVIDGIFYNEFQNGHMDYDLMAIDFYFFDDFRSVCYQQTEWTNGKIRTTGIVKGTAVKNGSQYVATFDDGSVFQFYIDDNEEDLWISLGDGYFRFKPCDLWYSDKDFRSANT